MNETASGRFSAKRPGAVLHSFKRVTVRYVATNLVDPITAGQSEQSVFKSTVQLNPAHQVASNNRITAP